MDTVYVETFIVSHATAWPSHNIEVASMQFQARQWWEQEREKFALVTSQLVIDEASAGDEAAAADRLALLVDCRCCRSRTKLECWRVCFSPSSLCRRKPRPMHYTLPSPPSQA